MKNHLFRRSLAFVCALLLCLAVAVPALVIPSSAEETDDSDILDAVTIMIASGDLQFPADDSVSLYADAWRIRTSTGTTFNLTSLDEGIYLCCNVDSNLSLCYYGDSVSFKLDCSNSYMFDDISGDSYDWIKIIIPSGSLTQSNIDILLSWGCTVSGWVDPNYKLGYNDGYSAGYTAGKADGEALHESDYNNGYTAGQTDAMNGTSSLKDLIFSIFSAPSDLINGILDFDLFGVNLAVLVKTLITLAVASLVIFFLFKLMRR